MTRLVTCLLVSLPTYSGCQAFFAPLDPLPVTPAEPPPESDVPRELAKVSLPAYTIEPPDVLIVLAKKIVPKSPHFIETFDVLGVQVPIEQTLVDQPIISAFAVDREGKVDLGPAYGKVFVVGMTVLEAQEEIAKHLGQFLIEPQVSVSLVAGAGEQQISGEHLVGPDGTINLGTYGNVYISGMTISEAKLTIEKHLSEFLESPEIVISVGTFNSKFYYIITAGGGFGDNVVRIGVTGNETVLDAVSAIGGLSQISSKKMWISRPAPNGVGCEQILPVNWNEITRGASTATNYQIMPGDRLFIAEDKLLAFDNFVGKVTRPFERVFGFTILGSQMLNRIRNVRQRQQGFGF